MYQCLYSTYLGSRFNSSSVNSCKTYLADSTFLLKSSSYYLLSSYFYAAAPGHDS